MFFASKLIAASYCPSSARAQFRFKFRRIPCALGHIQRDAQGNSTQETSPDSGQQRTQYDALGLPQQVTDA
ncbi:RHS repeat domain-containing protein, partial [Simplicispira lacusdiani]|uniref:RHS repeat domain-containing protein n=1 Tax=Simplicispira lacusdiani TaxID=2213010 RepID=UPI001E5A18C0